MHTQRRRSFEERLLCQLRRSSMHRFVESLNKESEFKKGKNAFEGTQVNHLFEFVFLFFSIFFFSSFQRLSSREKD